MQHLPSQPGREAAQRGLDRLLSMVVAAAQGSLWAAAYAPAHEELRPHPDDFVIMKPRFSAFYGTNLDGILNALGTETL